MIGILICIVAFAVTNAMTRRSLGAGFVALMTFGYSYGLLRARIADVGTHFFFDAALLGLYLAAFTTPITEETRARTETAKWWTLALVAWPVVCMAYSPALGDVQPVLIQIVGLRAAVLMLPCIVLGARLRRADIETMAPAFAVLNLIALAFALLEYIFGIEAFIPQNAVSYIVYQSQLITDSGATFYRIPSTFSSSHAYGGMMALSVAFLSHGLELGGRMRLLCWAGLAAAVLGVFLCGSRLPFVELTLATIYVLGTMRMRGSTIFAFALTAAAVAYIVANFERFQRFETLGDSEMIRSRISMSVNMSFFEILSAYPLGAGLASAAGTSIPYFLLGSDMRGQIGLESEYAHVLVEQGLIGLALWISFIVYSTLRGNRARECSPTSNAYMQSLVAVAWATGLIGVGLLSSIPGTALLLAAMGLGLASPVKIQAKRALDRAGPSTRPSRTSTGRGALAVQRASR
jgi:hypothetical protein